MLLNPDSAMDRIEENYSLILAEIRRFALMLGAKVVPKPKVSMWMILIPILFIFYIYDMQKYKKGRSGFAEHYANTPERALVEAVAVLREGRPHDIAAIVAQSDLPAEGRAFLSDIYAALVEHYVSLLEAEGPDWATLIRHVYGNKTNYLLFLNRLNQLEKQLNQVLLDSMNTPTEGTGDIVRAMEVHSENLRRGEADLMFS